MNIRNVAKLLFYGSVAAVSVLSSQAFAQLSWGTSEPGRVAGETVMPIGTAATAVIKQVLVKTGARVRAGQVLVTLDCRPLEAEVQVRQAQLASAEAALERVRNGARPEEIAAAAAGVSLATAQAENAQKALERTQALREGVTVSQARALETRQEARASAAQLEEAQARLALLRAGSRQEDVLEAQARRRAAAAQVEETAARLDQCSVRAPVDGVVLGTLVTPGQFISSAVPTPLLTMRADGPP